MPQVQVWHYRCDFSAGTVFYLLYRVLRGHVLVQLDLKKYKVKHHSSNIYRVYLYIRHLRPRLPLSQHEHAEQPLHRQVRLHGSVLQVWRYLQWLQVVLISGRYSILIKLFLDIYFKVTSSDLTYINGTTASDYSFASGTNYKICQACEYHEDTDVITRSLMSNTATTYFSSCCKFSAPTNLI